MSKKLAIRGHSTRGKEVIKLLEMMGGSNIFQHDGEANSYSYYINGNVILHDRLSIAEDDDFEIFTLEGFLDKFPFKINDYVRIPEYESEVGICGMRWDSLSKCMEYMVYRCDDEEWYTTMELLKYNDYPNEQFNWETQPKRDIDKAEFMIKHMILPNKSASKLEYEIIDGYEFDKIENNKIILKPIKPKYPTTYEECCKIMQVARHTVWFDYDDVSSISKEGDEYESYIENILCAFRKLKICRDAYWKIAGEEMGLDGPWKPDFTDLNSITYYGLYNELKYSIINPSQFIFPTVEMRDAFYKNFKNLIEKCK